MVDEKNTLKDKILRLKKEKNAIILAHNYQIDDIQDIADFLGDSLELAKKSMSLEEETIVFCGVRFMAETAKILSPQKKVLLPVLDAGCPLADMISPDELITLKKNNPDAMVVSYVNTSAEIKALSDVCCTSANAIEVVKNVPSKRIIFTPDKNLGWWVKKNVPEKEIIIWQGYCLVHERFRKEEVEDVKKLHPDAEVIVHPECQADILEMADFVASTSGMLKRVKQSKAKKFIIGTEAGMIYRLKKENPDKTFYSLGSAKMCVNMKKITLKNLLESLEKDRYCIELEPEVVEGAKKSLEEMVKYV